MDINKIKKPEIKEKSFDDLKKEYVSLIDNASSLRKDWINTLSEKNKNDKNIIKTRIASLKRNIDDIQKNILHRTYPDIEFIYREFLDELSNINGIFIFNKIEYIKNIIEKINNRILYITNLEIGTNYDELYNLLSSCGDIIWIQFDSVKLNNKLEYFARVWFNDSSVANNTLHTYDKKCFNKKILRIYTRNDISEEFKVKELSINNMMNLKKTKNEFEIENNFLSATYKLLTTLVPFAPNIKCSDCKRCCYSLSYGEKCCHCMAITLDIKNEQNCPKCIINIY